MSENELSDYEKQKQKHKYIQDIFFKITTPLIGGFKPMSWKKIYWVDVLKKYQNPEREAENPHARWFCAVKSNFTYGEFEYGDTYVADIKANGVKQLWTILLKFF